MTVVENENAYLSFDRGLRCGPGRSAGRSQSIVHNQFGSKITHVEMQVTALDGHARVRAAETPHAGGSKSLGPADSTRIVFDDTYQPGESIDLEVSGPAGLGNKTGAYELQIKILEATGPGIRVTDTIKTYTVRCPGQKSSTAQGDEDSGSDEEEENSSGGNGNNGNGNGNNGNGNNGNNGNGNSNGNGNGNGD
ncbi:hypothetical protein [Haloplanus vescus]|uniref:hypothetical protein n=1 Tax=Haloplanus vescus TaxID=555874 RepID=UPI00115F7895|nr:hypothetical protein [Haloplanus vescus]